jgi:hypothetical protein
MMALIPTKEFWLLVIGCELKKMCQSQIVTSMDDLENLMHIHNYPINATRCFKDVIECTGIIMIINLLAIDHGLLCCAYMCGELRFVLHGS